MSIAKWTVIFPTKLTGPFFMEWGPKDAHKHMTETVPKLIGKIRNISGDGGVGTVREVDMVEGHHHERVVMHTDGLDMENHDFKFHLVDGGYVKKKVSSAKYSCSFTKTADYGWCCKFTGWLTPLPATELTDEDVTKDEEFWVSCVKYFEEYKESNPDHGYPV